MLVWRGPDRTHRSSMNDPGMTCTLVIRDAGAMELIAHRAGNRIDTVGAGLDVADAIELDVHLFRGRLEVRHSKVLWPFRIYWERWELLPSEDPPDLAGILAAIPAGAHVWLDLKGFTGRLTRNVLRHMGEHRPLTVSTRSWWTLRSIRQVDGIRTFRSVGTRWQLWAVQRTRFGSHDGIVMHERFARADVVARLLRLTPNVVVWAVDDLDRASDLARIGVTGIIADDLDLIARIRSELG